MSLMREGANPDVIISELMHLTYILLRAHATKENVSIYEEYNKEQIDLILEKTSLSMLNQFWQILLKEKKK